MLIDISPTVITIIGICFVFASGMLALVQVNRINKER